VHKLVIDYSPFDQVYRKHNDKTQWKINAGVNANKQLGQLMSRQYMGSYTDSNTGLVNLDGRLGRSGPRYRDHTHLHSRASGLCVDTKSGKEYF